MRLTLANHRFGCRENEPAQTASPKYSLRRQHWPHASSLRALKIFDPWAIAISLQLVSHCCHISFCAIDPGGGTSRCDLRRATHFAADDPNSKSAAVHQSIDRSCYQVGYRSKKNMRIGWRIKPLCFGSRSPYRENRHTRGATEYVPAVTFPNGS